MGWGFTRASGGRRIIIFLGLLGGFLNLGRDGLGFTSNWDAGLWFWLTWWLEYS